MRQIGKRFFVDDKVSPYQGEMAEVFCAYDSANSMQKVAIKLFRENFESRLVLEAFARECESLEKLNSHPNIVPLMDYGTDDGTSRKYIALDWAPRTLLSQIRAVPVPDWDGFYAAYGAPILGALSFAFSRDIIHRDVKPQNILIDQNDVVRVADFGISKFKRYYRPGVTLAQFKSEPYAPQIEAEEFADTRDVYGFAVLSLECLSPTDFCTYDDVYQALDAIALPDEIEPILRRALEREPHLRPSNVVELKDELDAAMRRRAARIAVRRDVPVHITLAAAETMKTEFQEASQSTARDRLLRELNEVCGIDYWPMNDPEEEAHLALLTAEFRFRAVLDEQKNALTIIGAARSRPSQLERQRERAWLPNLRFVISPAAGRAEAMEWLRTELDAFVSDRRTSEAKRAETELFEKWSAILRLKSDVEEAKKAPVRFNRLDQDGSRLVLQLAERIAEDVMGEDRIIRVPDGPVIQGVVEQVTEDTLVLYCNEVPSLHNVPRQGELVTDTRLGEIAIRRQNFALDALRFGRAVRPELREILIGRQAVREPTPCEHISFFQDPLDNDKKEAIAVALGSPDLLVVEGPPGTGKTRFITELIAQFLRAKPDGRVLLSSQTHNALDHALAGIEALGQHNSLSHRLVRIARKGDPRISPDMEHLLLENGVHNWLEDAIQRSDRFLHDWAQANGISDEDVRIGLALADLRASTIRMKEANDRRAECNRSAELLRAEEIALKDKPDSGDEYRLLLAELRFAEDELQEVEEERVIARRALAAARKRAETFPVLSGGVETLTETDMEALEADFVNHATKGAEFREMLTLSDEWRQRFGRSTDFHGAFLAGCDVVAGTCIGVAAQSLSRVEFDLCIIDEASKATPTEMLVPMTRAKKWVVVGDPKQLPPFVGETSLHPKALERYGLKTNDVRHTLLDHLIASVPDHCRRSLLSQHRMIKPIGELVSHCFYAGNLRNENTNSDEWLAKARALPRPVTWFTTANLKERSETTRRNVVKNFAELRVISRLLSRIQLAATSGKREYSVALLSGYAGQVREFQDMITASRASLDRLRIECSTVDAYQGREADIAVYSVTRSNPEGRIGFLREYERLNVALSRPKLGLAIVGDSHFCESVEGQNPFADVIAYMRRTPDDCVFVEEVE